MSEKVYVTREEGEALSFNYDFKQIFHHESSQPKTLPEYVLVKWYIKQPEQAKQLALEVWTSCTNLPSQPNPSWNECSA